MRKLFWLIFILSFTFLIIFTSKVFARGGDDIVVRYREHFEIKRLSNHQENAFDTIEIISYLVLKDPAFYPNAQDTIHYNGNINGKGLIFSNKHKVLITEPGDISFGYLDIFYDVGQFHNMYTKNVYIYGSNHYSSIIPFQYAWFSNAFYVKPDYSALTKYSWNQIQVELRYIGANPKPNGNYCFANEIGHGLRDDNHYHIDHVNWYNNGNLLNHHDSLFTIEEAGDYYAEIVSNFGYKYYSDTIKITTYQFAKYTDCIDAQIEANNESKIIGKKGFEDIINKKLGIHPNPVIDFIELDFKTCNEVNANFELYNLSGIRLIQKMFHFNKDENSQVQLDLTGVSPGLYVLCFDFNGIKKRTKIIKQ